MVKLSKNAKKVLNSYLPKDNGTRETPKEMFQRVAKNIAKVDKEYEGKRQAKKSEREFYEVMNNLEFLPNLPTLVNAGRSLQQLAACFVLPIPDDMAGIFEAVKDMALIQKTGGGTGYSFSRLRSKGTKVRETGGTASGPVSFMKVFDCATEAIKAGGIRRGANMGILSVNHPEIKDFINCKQEKKLSNFNISVALNDEFMEAVNKDKQYQLIDPHTNETKKELKAKSIFNQICKNAWDNGDPGVIFIDKINKDHPIDERIEATNPCSEQPLLPYESCVLGSINLSSITSKKGLNWNRLKELVKIGVHFLDNCVDASEFPIDKIEEKIKQNRKIGLGIMGFADSLIKRGINYDSEEAIKEAERVMKFIQDKAREASKDLASRGSFPNKSNSIYKGRGKGMRNATVTTIAPTGTISILADCSSSIEPLFNVIFQRYTTHGTLTEFNPLFREVAEEHDLSEKELKSIAKEGSIQKTDLPKEVKNKFVTAHDIPPEQHVKVQAAFQKYTDNGVSKTVNLKNNAKVEEVKEVYKLAWKLGCKGLTVYRDRSRDKQVLNLCEECEVI